MTAKLEPLDDVQRRRVESAMGRVQTLARLMSRRVSHASEDELRSAGYEGLIAAAKRYDPASGVPFVGFAHHRIRGAMIDAVRRASPAVRRRNRALKLLEATQAVLDDAHRTQALRGGSDTRTLAERVRAAADLVSRTTAAVIASKAAPADPDTVSRGERSVEDTVVQRQLAGHLREAVEDLPDPDQALIGAIYHEGLSMGEYAKRVGKNKSTISRHHARILSRLAATLQGRPRPPP